MSTTSNARARLPFVLGEKEKLIREKRRANRVLRMKQVREIEKVCFVLIRCQSEKDVFT